MNTLNLNFQKNEPLFLFFIALLFPLVSWGGENIVLNVGQQKVLNVPNTVRASVGTPNVADIQAIDEKNQILVIGKRPGSTQVLIWDDSGKSHQFNVRVKSYQDNLFAKIQKQVGGIEGIKTSTTNGKVFIEGQVYRAQDALIISNLAKRYSKIINLTQFNPQTLSLIQNKILQDLRASGHFNVEVFPKKDALVLQGEVLEEKDIYYVESLANRHYHNIISEMRTALDRKPMVMVDIKFIEVHKNKIDQFGIDFPSQVRAANTATLNPLSQQIGIASSSQFDLSLNMLSQKGVARVLSNPKLLVRDQQKASFLAGGEIPIRLISERTAEIVYKPYGVNLTVQAKIDKMKKVLLDLEVKISDLDPSLSIEGIPAMLEHHINTQAELHLGESIALGGLYQSRDRKTVKKTPLFGHIPVIGELFKSRAFQKNQSEFLVLLTPLEGHVSSKSQRDLRHKFSQHKNDLSTYKFSLMD